MEKLTKERKMIAVILLSMTVMIITIILTFYAGAHDSEKAAKAAVALSAIGSILVAIDLLIIIFGR